MVLSRISSENRLALISSLFLFASLCVWSLSGPLNSGYDSTFHLANIWCANGEKAGICENLSVKDSAAEADFPAALASNPQTREFVRTQLVGTSNKSPFYSIMNLLVTKDTTRSVLLIRFFNSFLAGLVFFLLMFFGTKKSRTAALSSWTFTVVPIMMATLWQPSPRAWGYLSVMSSWCFLYIALNETSQNKKRKASIWVVFAFSLLLAFTSRFDATLFTIFTCGIVLIIHLFKRRVLKVRNLVIFSTIGIALFLLFRLLSSKILWYTQFSFTSLFSSRQTLFVLIHLPENIADGFGLGLRYPDLGPNAIGIFGVALFAIAITIWLSHGNSYQIASTSLVFGFMLLAMFQIAFYWPEANEASGVYTAALLTVSLGVAAIYSGDKPFFPGTSSQRAIVISIISISHALTLYSKFVWSVRRSVANNTYTELSLNSGWWWNSPISPNVVFLTGAISFPIWLIISWKLISQQSEKSASQSHVYIA